MTEGKKEKKGRLEIELLTLRVRHSVFTWVKGRSVDFVFKMLGKRKVEKYNLTSNEVSVRGRMLHLPQVLYTCDGVA